MRKKILFVDDEAMVLHGLQRVLHTLRNEWEMVFVDSGAKALEVMAQTPFDVIMADMRMPGMNGAELLNEVMTLYPQTMRFILSGYSDEDLILQSLGATHQFIAKPCDPEMLKSIIQRTSDVSSKLFDPDIKKLIGRMERLPSLPALYTEIINKLKDPDVMIGDITAIISRDLGMTAKILQLVNSAFFGLPQHVTNLDIAVTYLGLNLVRNLCLTINVFSQYKDIEITGGFSAVKLWDHSLKTAYLAQKICHMENSGKSMEDDAFTAGLLHDAGRLILASNFPEQYQQVILVARQEQCDLYTAEKKVFNHTHSTLGGYLLGLWGLPVSVVEAVLLHHEPDHTSPDRFCALTAVHAANALVQSDATQSEGVITSPIDVDYLRALKMETHVAVWREAYGEKKPPQ